MSEIIWQPGITLAQVEKEVIQKAYKFFDGNKTKTAQALGIAIRTLDNKLMIYEGKLSAKNEENGNDPAAGICVESNAQVSEEQAVHVRERKKVQGVSSR